jgi:hypothetical protein
VARPSRAGFFGAERHAEVEQLGLAAGCDDNVRRLDIAMYHATPMGIFQRRKHLPNVAYAFEWTSRPRRAHLPLQVFAFDEFHHHGDLFIGLKGRM